MAVEFLGKLPDMPRCAVLRRYEYNRFLVSIGLGPEKEINQANITLNVYTAWTIFWLLLLVLVIYDAVVSSMS
jgi:hypothetical protein